MAVREFNGSTDYLVLDNGIVGAFNSGGAGMTLVALVKPTTIGTADKNLILAGAGTGGTGTALMAMYKATTAGNLNWGADDPGSDSSAAVGLTASAWQVVGLNKAAGTATPRLHRKVLGSGSWTHADGSLSVGNTGTTCQSFVLGKFPSGSPNFSDYRIAVAAFFTSALTDTDFVNIESNATTAYLNSLGPAALWDFNQASTLDPLLDLTGGGADGTTGFGMTVVTGDDPAWTFGLSAPSPPAPVIGQVRAAPTIARW